MDEVAKTYKKGTVWVLSMLELSELHVSHTLKTHSSDDVFLLTLLAVMKNEESMLDAERNRKEEHS